jgi:hypothetical protein
MWAKRAVLAALLGSAAIGIGCCECCRWCVPEKTPVRYLDEGTPPMPVGAPTTQPAAGPTGAYGGTGN